MAQYNIAEKHLNIVSHIEHPDVEKIVDERIAERDTKIEQLEGQISELSTFVRHLAERPVVPPKTKKKNDIYLSWDPDKLKAKGKK